MWTGKKTGLDQLELGNSWDQIEMNQYNVQ